MADEKEPFETRTVTLTVTKTRVEAQAESGDGSNCTPWFIERRGGHIYTCRWCATGPPTYFPYKECIQLPD